MWLIDVCGGWGVIVWSGVQYRWEKGLRLGLGSGLGLGLGLGELEEKWRKKEKKQRNTAKGENVFIRFKVDKTEKKTIYNFFHWFENSKLVRKF